LGQFAKRQALTSEPYSGLRPGRIGRETNGGYATTAWRFRSPPVESHQDHQAWNAAATAPPSAAAIAVWL